MMLTHVGNQELEGQPLTWTKDEMLLLSRDGQLHAFAPKYAKNSKKTGTVLRGY